MTRDELINMMSDAKYWHQIPKLADDILAAIEKERAGEVVLWQITKTDNTLVRVSNGTSDKYKHFTGVDGQLIFREAKP